MYCHIDMERLLPLHMYREFLHQSLVTSHCCFSCGIYILEEVSLNTTQLWMPNFIQIDPTGLMMFHLPVLPGRHLALCLRWQIIERY